MRSVYNAVRALSAVRPVAQGASAATSVVIDTQGFNSAMFLVNTGAATGTPTSYSVACKVQESDNSNGSSASDITGATATLDADAKAAQIRVEGLGLSRKRYLLLVMTPAFVGGTSPAALISGAALLGRAYNSASVANSATEA